jgi:hypothetical protein
MTLQIEERGPLRTRITYLILKWAMPMYILLTCGYTYLVAPNYLSTYEIQQIVASPVVVVATVLGMIRTVISAFTYLILVRKNPPQPTPEKMLHWLQYRLTIYGTTFLLILSIISFVFPGTASTIFKASYLFGTFSELVNNFGDTLWQLIGGWEGIFLISLSLLLPELGIAFLLATGLTGFDPLLGRELTQTERAVRLFGGIVGFGFGLGTGLSGRGGGMAFAPAGGGAIAGGLHSSLGRLATAGASAAASSASFRGSSGDGADNGGEGGSGERNIPEEPVGDLKARDANWLKRHGVDPEILKKENGLVPVKHYDIYVDRAGNLWGLRKGDPLQNAQWLDHLDFFK